MGWREQLTGWNPRLWAGWRPNGIGEQKPNHYRDMTRVAWDEALSVLARGLRHAPADRVALYLTSRGLTNEVYYAAAKAARALGVASVDSAARVCHAPSTVGLRQTVGVAATTCSFQDV